MDVVGRVRLALDAELVFLYLTRLGEELEMYSVWVNRVSFCVKLKIKWRRN